MDLPLPFNFLLTEELKRCDDPSKDAVNYCLKAALSDIVTDSMYYTGRHIARTVIKETDVKLAIALYLRKKEHSIEYSHWFDKEQFFLSDDGECSDSEAGSSSGSGENSDEGADQGGGCDASLQSDTREYRKYSWVNVRYEEQSDVSESESSDPGDLDSECEDNFRRPEEIATEARWLYNVYYNEVRALVWEECAAHLDELTLYLHELLEILKLEMKPSDGMRTPITSGFEQSLSFDSVAVILPLLCFLTWNATLALRGDRRSPFMHAFWGQRRHFVVFLMESGMHKVGPFAAPIAASTGPSAARSTGSRALLSAQTAANSYAPPGKSGASSNPLSYLSKPHFTHAKMKLFNNYGCAMGSVEVVGSDATRVVLGNDEVVEITIKRVETVRKVSHRNEAVGAVFRNSSLCNCIMMYIPAYKPCEEVAPSEDTQPQPQPVDLTVGDVMMVIDDSDDSESGDDGESNDDLDINSTTSVEPA